MLKKSNLSISPIWVIPKAIILSGFALLCLYGIFSNHLFSPQFRVWSPGVGGRIVGFCTIFLVTSALVFMFFRKYTRSLGILLPLLLVLLISGIGPVITSIFIVLSGLCLGDYVSKLSRDDRFSPIQSFLINIFIGLAIYMAILYFASHYKVNYRPIYFILLLIPYFISWKPLSTYTIIAYKFLTQEKTQTPGEFLSAALLLFVIILAAYVSLLPINILIGK